MIKKEIETKTYLINNKGVVINLEVRKDYKSGALKANITTHNGDRFKFHHPAIDGNTVNVWREVAGCISEACDQIEKEWKGD